MKSFLLDRFNGECWFCGEVVEPDEEGEIGYSKDHLRPSKRGGKNFPYNYVCCCVACNSRKGDMSAWKFREMKYNVHRENRAYNAFENSGPLLNPIFNL